MAVDFPEVSHTLLTLYSGDHRRHGHRDFFTALVLTYFIIVLYMAPGGMWAVLLIVAIQLIIFVFGTVLLLVQSLVNLGGLAAGSLSPVLIAVLLFPSISTKSRTVLTPLAVSAALVTVSHAVTRRELKAGAGFFVWSLDPVLIGVLVFTVVWWSAADVRGMQQARRFRLSIEHAGF